MKNVKNRSDIALKIAPYVSLVASIIYIITTLSIASDSRIYVSNIFFVVPIAIANFLIVIAYTNHNKNTMKSLLGFILGGLVLLSIHYAFSYYDPTKISCILKTIIFVIIAIFVFNQFLLTNTHYSSPIILFTNQIMMSLLTVISIGYCIATAISGNGVVLFVSLLVFVLATMLMMLIMEMKINDAKVKRSDKGYVFEISKTDDSILPKEDMFISNKLFYSLPWVTLVGLVLLFIFNAIFDQAITWGYSVRYLIHLIVVVCLFALIYAYKLHNKDVMKVMLGFLLGILLFENVFEVITINSESITTLKSMATIGMCVINLIFLVDHLLLTKTHASNTKIVNMMKVVYVVYAILTIVTAVDCSIYYLIGQGNNYLFFMFKPLIWIICTFPVITAILTIDTRVNGFKIKRENNK